MNFYQVFIQQEVSTHGLKFLNGLRQHKTTNLLDIWLDIFTTECVMHIINNNQILNNLYQIDLATIDLCTLACMDGTIIT